jgi:hypothetical protein
VFTKQQMYFECYGMYCCESLQLPLEALHQNDGQGYKAKFCSKNGVGIFPRGVDSRGDDILRRIDEYSGLDLTNPSDILRGMTGIFNAFERSQLKVESYAGIPLLPKRYYERCSESTEHWSRTMAFVAGLFWDTDCIADRRPGFPSWCWTGWQVPVKWKVHLHGTIWPTFEVDPEILVSVELVDGRVMTLEKILNSLAKSTLLTCISSAIRLSVWTVEIRLKGCYVNGLEVSKGTYSAILRQEDGGYLIWKFDSTSDMDIKSLYKGIILGQDLQTTSSYITGYVILVCRKIGDAWERVGFGWLNHNNHTRYLSKGVRGNTDNRRYDLGTLSWSKPVDLIKSWEEIRLQ